ncbi:unnamed protein product, partial [Musa acuminata subsp. burmannicoides]
ARLLSTVIAAPSQPITMPLSSSRLYIWTADEDGGDDVVDESLVASAASGRSTLVV